jgi:hypothetical protein
LHPWISLLVILVILVIDLVIPVSINSALQPETLRRNTLKGPETVLDNTRSRNLAIAQRRIGADVDVVADAITRLDFEMLPADKAQLLRTEFVPTDDELKLLTARHDSGKPMAAIDRYVVCLVEVEASLACQRPCPCVPANIYCT